MIDEDYAKIKKDLTLYLQHCRSGVRIEGSSLEWRPNLQWYKNDDFLTNAVTARKDKNPQKQLKHSRPAVVKMQQESVVAKFLEGFIVMPVHVTYRKTKEPFQRKCIMGTKIKTYLKMSGFMI